MVQDEGHTKDEVASIGPYTNYLTLRTVRYSYFYIQTFMHAKKLKQCNKIVKNKIKQKSMDYNYLQYYETLIKYVNTYNIVTTMQILKTTE